MIDDLNEANDLILRRIGEVPEKTILGFLPLSEAEQSAVLKVVRDSLAGPVSIRQLLRTRPGAATYSLMLARSISALPGGQFWPCVEEQLGLHLNPSEQHGVSDEFLFACSRLGVMEGTVDVGWVYAAPFIFQAGILHYWKHSLADALRRTIAVLPAPDLEDPSVVGRFVAELGRRIVNQPILSRTLDTAIGPLLVHRLVAAYLKNDFAVLPAHLREPMREVFEGVGRGAVLQVPYLAFNVALDEIEFVLPAQSGKVATMDSRWFLEGHSYRATTERRFPFSKIQNRQIEASLQRLAGNYQDQTFQIDGRLDRAVPFRIFREDTLRERRADAGHSCSLPAGEYLIVLAPGVHAGEDEADIQDCDGFRLLRHLNLRPGDEPLALCLDDQSWEISCDLQPGIFVDREKGSSVRLEGGELLHYGHSIGLVAYFPANGEREPQFKLSVRCPEQDFIRENVIGASGVTNRVYQFSENLREVLPSILADLSPGVHRVEMTISHADRRIEHRVWFWQGLDRIDESRGFDCSRFPENVDLSRCQGLVKGDGSILAFRSDYNRPLVRVAVTRPAMDLDLPRAGVQVMMISPGEDWEEEPSINEPLVVSRDDKRVLQFRSGGFQKWEIRCGNSLVGTLDSRRSNFTISLAGLCRTHRGAGVIIARREDGKEVKLMTFSMPLVATTPRFTQNHGMAFEEWTFDVPVEELFEVAVQLTDFSDVPDPTPTEEQIVASVSDGFADCSGELFSGLTVSSHRVEQGETALIRFSVSWQTEALKDHLLMIDFMRRPSDSGSWLPLRCVERQGYSSLRIVLAGGTIPDESATWWRRLRSARRADNQTQTAPALAQALEVITLENLGKGLAACRELLGWKYPGPVWKECANWFQDYPVYLGRHRFNIHDGSASVWWEHDCTELCDYAAVAQAPVVKAFLFGSQPHTLRIPPERVEVLEGRGFASPLGRSLNLGAEILAKGSLFEFVAQTYHSNQLDPSGIQSFDGFRQVIGGQSRSLGRFDFHRFLKGLLEKTKATDEENTRIEVQCLLSPEHLLQCVRAINRRCNLIAQIAETGQHHIVATHAQVIERGHQSLEILMPAVAGRLGITHQFTDPYAEENFTHWWKPPCLRNRWSEKVAEITWALAAISRLAANGRANPAQFETWMSMLFAADGTNVRGIQNGVNVTLSLAPELFAFYVALFDLAFAEHSPN